MSDLLNYYVDTKFTSTEGRRGLENLARLCNALGYKDLNKYGQMQGGACLGDILDFLEDNSGAIQALIDWVQDGSSPEWEENLGKVLVDDARWFIVEDSLTLEGPFDSKEESEQFIVNNSELFEGSTPTVGYGIDVRGEFIPVNK